MEEGGGVVPGFSCFLGGLHIGAHKDFLPLLRGAGPPDSPHKQLPCHLF